MAETRAQDVAEIRAILDGRRQALHAKDARAMTARSAADVLIYDLAPPLATRGIDRASIEAWLATWEGPIEEEVHDLEIETGGDLALSTGLNRMRGTKTDGERIDIWLRTTLGYRRIEGRWTVVHEHASVPFYMDGSLKAAVDLKPQPPARSP